MKKMMLTLSLLVVFVTPASTQTIADLAIAANSGGAYAGSFDTLLTAVTCTGLVAPLATPKKQYTVFAPTDDAFAALGLNAGNVCSAFSLETLAAVLSYHVAPGRRLAEDVLAGDNVRTLGKSFVYPYVDGGSAFLRDNSSLTEDAQIIVTDLKASNGVIHVIDSVLLP